MTSKLPKVSVIIPFNRDRGWLKDAIESVYNQTYEGEIHLLTSDKVNPETHKGFTVSQNINEALKHPHCQGEYEKFFAEDDLLTPICIEASVNAIIEQGCDFLHGNVFNRKNGANYPYYPTHKFPTLETLIPQCYVHGLSLFYKLPLLKGVGFDENLTTGEEWNLNLSLLKQGKKMGYVDKFLGIYRHHDEMKSLGKEADQAKRFIQHEAIRNRYR